MRAREVVDNVWLVLVARGAMCVTPIVLAVLAWLAVGYLEARFSQQATATAIVGLRVDKVEDAARETAETVGSLEDRVLVIETNGARGRADREAFQDQTFARLDRMQETIVQLSTAIAALNATIQTMRDRADAGRGRSATVTR